MMIGFIISLALAFLWLGYESDWMRVRLMVGDLPQRKLKFEPTFNCRYHHHELTWELPARTIKIYGSALNLFKGCNKCRARLLKSVVKAQNSKANNPYPASHYTIGLAGGINYGYGQPCGDIEIKVDGIIKLKLDGDFKRGMIKQAMRA